MTLQLNISEIRSLVKSLDAGLNPGGESRPASRPDLGGGFGRLLHERLLSSVGRPARGMTAPDYLANPLMRPQQSADSKKTENRSAEQAAEAQKENEPVPAACEAENGGPVDNPAKELKTAARRTVTPEMARVEKSIRAAAEKYDLPPDLIRSVIRAESNFDPGAVSRAGARGLMQLMPATAEELGVKDSFDIHQNIDGGSRYLRQMLDRFDGDLKLALSAYNAGPGTVLRFGGNVPYRETQLYVQRVMDYSGITA